MLAPLGEAEVARRLPVWVAMADLFLDTESELFAPTIARAIVAAGFSLAEAEDMLRWDVRPAFYFNLLAVAGEWAGWSDAFVRERVLATRLGRAKRWLLGHDRLFPRDEWQRVVAEVTRLQAAARSTGSVSAIQPPPSTRSPA